MSPLISDLHHINFFLFSAETESIVINKNLKTVQYVIFIHFMLKKHI